MKIIDLNENNISEYKTEVAICLGNFDGLHIAHKALIDSMSSIADKLGLKKTILLFENHTRELTVNNKPRLLMSDDDKLYLLEDMGLDIIYKLKFNQDIMKLEPEDFVRKILIEKLNVKSITVGFDYKFGYKAMGDVDLLKKLGEKYNIKIDIINPIYFNTNSEDKILISSTVVRTLIGEGKVDVANRILGRPYKIEGTVVPGCKRGRLLGFPTANIKPDFKYVLPKEGIYATKVCIMGKKYLGATNVGRNLTFNGEEIKVETYIIDFNDDIYNIGINIEFIKYIREEIKFDNKEDLIMQIEEDVKIIKSI